ncbi:MAG: tetratricopeptide repeat protein [Myxococcota bacterium]
MAELIDGLHDGLSVEPRQPPAVTRGDSLGRYLVLGELGSGGMGTVLEAYDESLERTVAIKLLHPETSEEHAVRLRREALALAKLSHPNVVHVYEVGEADGQWFIAMELIDGVSLAEWQSEPRPWRECIDVYIRVGDGLAAAHAAGLVHRDFKPANCVVDRKGWPKVLDFGLVGGSVVPAVDETLEGTTQVRLDFEPLTRSGVVMGTPAYMALEQMHGEDIDSRSDQFSFCVSLYEALYGVRPFKGRTMATLRRSIARGSVRSQYAASVPMRLREALLRGLSADPELRWPSMDALLVELRRLAAPRTRQWLVIGVAVGMVAVGLGLGRIAEVGFRCQGARNQLEGVWDEGRRVEVRGALLATGVTYAEETWHRVARELDDYADAWESAHTEVCEATKVREEQSEAVMEMRLDCLRQRREDLRSTVDELSDIDGPTLSKVHQASAALPSLVRCDDVLRLSSLRERVPPPGDAEMKLAVDELGRRLSAARVAERFARYDEALQEVESVLREARRLGYAPLVARALHARGSLLDHLGRYEESERELESAFRIASEQGDDETEARAASALAYVTGFARGRIELGEVWGQVALSKARLLNDFELLGSAHGNMGAVQLNDDDYGAAESSFREASVYYQTALGRLDPRVLSMEHNLAVTLRNKADYDGALALIERVLKARVERLGEEHPITASTISERGTIHLMMGRNHDALRDYRRALEIVQASLGPLHPDAASEVAAVGMALARLGHHRAAVDHLRHGLELHRANYGDRHMKVALAMENLATALPNLGQHVEAERLFRKSVELRLFQFGEEHPITAHSYMKLGWLLGLQGRWSDAIQPVTHAIAVLEAALPAEHPDLSDPHLTLARAHQRLGELEAAEPHAREGLRIRLAAFGPEHPRTLFSRNLLGEILVDRGTLTEARTLFEESVPLVESTLGPEHERMAEALVGLARIAEAEGEVDVAIARARRAVDIRERNGVEIEFLAEGRFVLAQALEPRNPRLAREQAVRACDDYRRALPDTSSEVAKIEQWIAEHGGARAP